MSNAVLEHVDDMQRVVSELYRVTKPDGISYHLWHNYYSYSGGHMPERMCETAPWGHLRGIHQTHGLNRLRPDEIESLFSERFTVLGLSGVDRLHRKRGIDPGFRHEREDLLSQILAPELSDYDRELLLTRAYLLVGRRQQQ
jgi:SAM-dependent methyltransferase